jgi:hypothetical protein
MKIVLDSVGKNGHCLPSKNIVVSVARLIVRMIPSCDPKIDGPAIKETL